MKTYRIRKLDWQPHEYARALVADTPFGRIFLYDSNSGWWASFQSFTSEPSTLEECKVAAESWYLSRLLPALEEVDA